ncbi:MULTISPECIES: replication-relaxation family protein [Pontibacillus]|uniref:Replication-relaxation family protein n=1 Tax=Pontibacillus chungwhensis TaxID=265426 RepID=A0ABY8UZ42_9BACI|nr:MULTISPECIES: replication-relaxation family protein [Pontibacillus]MCD5324808.1 replication-relaxation family protein [Pontibacillus sp. HN14]WIF98767.1 replication-relaxation family protein [Pontibacillus chungwhensis]
MLKHLQRMEREEKILSNLDKLGIATRKQLQVINNLGGDRNANRILANMEDDGSIKSLRMDQKIYYVAHKGKEKIGSGKALKDKAHLAHTLMRNDLYIYLGTPKGWKNEASVDFPYNGEETTLVSDASFIKNHNHHFIEIDNTQTMKTNREKIDRYRVLFNLIKENYDSIPVLIWYTVSSRRQNALEDYCNQLKINSKVLSLKDLCYS